MPSGARLTSYLAFDLGAESGRAVLAHLHAGILAIDEIHRFPNHPIKQDDSLRWDVRNLWDEMRKALACVRETELAGVGVDAWGVVAPMRRNQADKEGIGRRRSKPAARACAYVTKPLLRYDDSVFIATRRLALPGDCSRWECYKKQRRRPHGTEPVPGRRLRRLESTLSDRQARTSSGA